MEVGIQQSKDCSLQAMQPALAFHGAALNSGDHLLGITSGGELLECCGEHALSSKFSGSSQIILRPYRSAPSPRLNVLFIRR